MGKESRAKAVAAEIMLRRADVPIVAMLALMDALLVDMERTAHTVTGDRDIRQHRAEYRQAIRRYVEKYNGTFAGKVTDDLVAKCDRYLCKVQDAMDTFFEDLTPEDLAEMERVKANWPQHTEAA
jgi:hypothetical protein